MPLTLDDLAFRYPGSPVEVLSGASLTVSDGESVAVMAPSGTGKSTLLSIAGLLVAPDRGFVSYGNGPLTARRAARDLARDVSWVLQTVSVLPRRSVLDNVVLGLLAHGTSRPEAEARGMEALSLVGIAHLASAQARSISGGEAQRAGIARALVTKPKVLIADEPTANLDARTAVAVGERMLEAARGTVAVLLATHDDRIGSLVERRVTLSSGQVVEL